MSNFKSQFIQLMSDRKFIHQITDENELDALMARNRITAYIGFDCTADSLHVGSLVQIMMLRHLQKCGHRPIVLMGGGTTKVGDPSGKDDARQLLNDEDIKNNKESIRKIFEKYLIFGDGPTDALMVDNDEWLSSLEYVKFLREYGRHFSVNRMLSFDSVKLRLDREQPLSFLEFNYMILQAYDFLELQRRHHCLLQMGGSDQWGNIINGVELARRVDQKSIFDFLDLVYKEPHERIDGKDVIIKGSTDENALGLLIKTPEKLVDVDGVSDEGSANIKKIAKKHKKINTSLKKMSRFVLTFAVSVLWLFAPGLNFF